MTYKINYLVYDKVSLIKNNRLYKIVQTEVIAVLYHN